MATYLVVLLQFKLTLLRQSAKLNLLSLLRERSNESMAAQPGIT